MTSKIAEGNIATASGSVTLAEASSSGLSGSVTLNYSADDSDITIQVLPKPDTDNEGTGNDCVSMISLSQTSGNEDWTLECASEKTSSTASKWEVRGSVTGKLNSQATAETQFTSPNSEISFSITDPDSSAFTTVNDGSSQLSNWSLSGITTTNSERKSPANFSEAFGEFTVISEITIT